MIYIDIPYVPENNRVDKASAIKEIQLLNMSDNEKNNVFKAIYNRHPRGVNFDNKDLKGALSLQQTLSRLGVPYRQVLEEPYS